MKSWINVRMNPMIEVDQKKVVGFGVRSYASTTNTLPSELQRELERFVTSLQLGSSTGVQVLCLCSLGVLGEPK